MKRLSIALVIAVATVALGVGAASAHDHHFKTKKVTINFAGGAYGDTFFGNVKSNKAACEKNRTVKVKRKVPGPDVIYGTDTTDSDGDYSVSNGFATPGDYYAKAKKKTLTNNNNHHHVCNGKKSDTISVP